MNNEQYRQKREVAAGLIEIKDRLEREKGNLLERMQIVEWEIQSVEKSINYILNDCKK